MAAQPDGRPGARTALRVVGSRLARWPRPAGAAVALAWMVLIASLSARPAGDLPVFPGSAYLANLAHAPLFGLLALWLVLVLPRAGGWPRLDAAGRAAVLLVVAGYAVIDEWHQSRVPGRTPTPLDLLTDVVAALAVLAVVTAVTDPAGDEGRVRTRLAGGMLACLAAAGLATWGAG